MAKAQSEPARTAGGPNAAPTQPVAIEKVTLSP
jgi:hypothetical protein